ncbi:MAG: hypothetical protein GY841_06075 [FCB group bacterium]|nr:hypothetical protein [FCB group bacterium]
MRMSEKKLAANRQNAQKSTGRRSLLLVRLASLASQLELWSSRRQSKSGDAASTARCTVP